MITKNLKSIFHVAAYDSLFPSLKLEGIFQNTSNEQLIISLNVLQFGNLVVFYAVHLLICHFPFLAFLKLLGMLNIIVMVLFNNVLLVPTVHMATSTIFKNIY